MLYVILIMLYLGCRIIWMGTITTEWMKNRYLDYVRLASGFEILLKFWIWNMEEFIR